MNGEAKYLSIWIFLAGCLLYNTKYQVDWIPMYEWEIVLWASLCVFEANINKYINSDKHSDVDKSG